MIVERLEKLEKLEKLDNLETLENLEDLEILEKLETPALPQKQKYNYEETTNHNRYGDCIHTLFRPAHHR